MTSPTGMDMKKAPGVVPGACPRDVVDCYRQSDAGLMLAVSGASLSPTLTSQPPNRRRTVPTRRARVLVRIVTCRASPSRRKASGSLCNWSISPPLHFDRKNLHVKRSGVSVPT
jgi:hypothetical protein